MSQTAMDLPGKKKEELKDYKRREYTTKESFFVDVNEQENLHIMILY